MLAKHEVNCKLINNQKDMSDAQTNIYENLYPEKPNHK